MCRLEQLGFTDVYDYVPGKSDWMAAGLPRAGESASVQYAGDLAVSAATTCRPADPLGDLLDRMRSEEQAYRVVTDDGGVVVGMLYADEAAGDTEAQTAGQAMREGPSTVRANSPADSLRDQLRDVGKDHILVTDPEGRLLGIFGRS